MSIFFLLLLLKEAEKSVIKIQLLNNWLKNNNKNRWNLLND